MLSYLKKISGILDQYNFLSFRITGRHRQRRHRQPVIGRITCQKKCGEKENSDGTSLLLISFYIVYNVKNAKCDSHLGMTTVYRER
jgi:hypothetical protein